MLRTVHCFLPVPGDPAALRAAFVDLPARWLPAARQVGPDRWLMTVHAGHIGRPVTVRVGSPWRADDTHWRSLSWDPVADPAEPSPLERFLPTLDGELGLNLAGDRATLLLDARYDPPGGPVGTALDTMALHRVARGTLDRLLADIAARLTAEALLTLPSPTAAAHEEHDTPPPAAAD